MSLFCFAGEYESENPVCAAARTGELADEINRLAGQKGVDPAAIVVAIGCTGKPYVVDPVYMTRLPKGYYRDTFGNLVKKDSAKRFGSL